MGTTTAIFYTLCAFHGVAAFYLPGLAPMNYCRADEVTPTCKSEIKLYENCLNTEKYVIPYEYNHFDFCTVEDGSQSPVENLGQVVSGVRPSLYKLEFLKDVRCATVCRKVYTGGDENSEKKLQLLKQGLAVNYQHHWIVDNMPVTWCYQLEDERQYCSTGFPMGCYSKEFRFQQDTCTILGPYNKPRTYYLFNHVDFTITYHSGGTEEWGSSFKENGGRIISVKVVPRSIKHTRTPDCESQLPLELPSSELPVGQMFQVTYTYSIKFMKNNTMKWSSRWDYILESMLHSVTSNIQYS